MLVLSRQRDEVVVFLDRQTKRELGTVTVVDIRGDKVRFGLVFNGWHIHRKEVFDEICRENNGEFPKEPPKRLGDGMLVLSRQRDEVIVAARWEGSRLVKIEATVVDIRGDKVRIGFNAGDSIEIHRKEVFDAITGEAQASDSAGHASI